MEEEEDQDQDQDLVQAQDQDQDRCQRTGSWRSVTQESHITSSEY